MSKTVQQRVNDLMIDFPVVHARLVDVLESLKSASFTYEEAKELVLTERDALNSQDEIEQDSREWEEVREIQHTIIQQYSNDE